LKCSATKGKKREALNITTTTNSTYHEVQSQKTQHPKVEKYNTKLKMQLNKRCNSMVCTNAELNKRFIPSGCHYGGRCDLGVLHAIDK